MNEAVHRYSVAAGDVCRDRRYRKCSNGPRTVTMRSAEASRYVPRVTSVEVQKNDPERVSVFLDGAFGFGASRMLAVARNLTPGRTLTGEEVEALVHDAEAERVFGAALSFLSYRQRSRHEVEAHFRRKGVDNQVLGAVVERLERAGMLDDREFAKFWIRNRVTSRPKGARALKAELRQKGLDSELIDEEVAGIGDEEPLAYRAGQKKARSLAAADGRTFITRLVAHLQRRGFSYPVASSVARRLLSERDEQIEVLGSSD